MYSVKMRQNRAFKTQVLPHIHQVVAAKACGDTHTHHERDHRTDLGVRECQGCVQDQLQLSSTEDVGAMRRVALVTACRQNGFESNVVGQICPKTGFFPRWASTPRLQTLSPKSILRSRANTPKTDLKSGKYAPLLGLHAVKLYLALNSAVASRALFETAFTRSKSSDRVKSGTPG